MADAFVAGQKLTAAFLNSLFKGSAGWEAYTPVWTGTTNPVIGNGSISGAWARAGRIVAYRIAVIMGSTTTYGTGAWEITVPTNSSGAGYPAGTATMYDASAGFARYHRHAFLNAANKIALAAEGPSTFVANATPFAWANGDALFIEGTYESAT